MNDIEAMRGLVSFLAKALVDDPDAVEVSVVEGEREIALELSVGPDDLGKVIGKEGRTARAMRTLIQSMSTKGRKRTHLDILE